MEEINTSCLSGGGVSSADGKSGKSGNIWGHAAVFMAYAIFGINLVTCKDVALSKTISPMALFTIRAATSALAFWLIGFFSHDGGVENKDLWKIALASMLGLFFPQITFLFAITMSTPVDVGIFGTLGPIFTMFVAFIAVGEPVTGKKVAGVLVSLAGVIFLILNSNHAANGVSSTSLLGYALLLGNSISFSCYLGIFRPLIKKYKVVSMMKWSFLFALILSLPFSTHGLLSANYAEMSSKVVAEIAFLVIFATCIAYFLIPYGQKTVRPTLVSMYNYVQPIIAAIFSAIKGYDAFTWQKFLAVFLVFAGVFLVNKSRAAE